MLLNKILNHKLLLSLLGQPPQLSTDFKQAYDLAYMVALVVVVAVLLRDYE